MQKNMDVYMDCENVNVQPELENLISLHRHDPRANDIRNQIIMNLLFNIK